MGENPLTAEEMQKLNASYIDSSELLRGIYQNILDWKKHEMQVNSEAAHRGFEELKGNIEHLLPFRFGTFQSPSRVKHRKRAANWSTPNNIPANENPSKKRKSNNGARAANNATRRANNAARMARANALRRLGAANNAGPRGTLPYNENGLG
jgi:hypothetical protein